MAVELLLLTTCGLTLPLAVNPEDTVQQLRAQVHRKAGVRPAFQCLTLNGVVLENGQLLEHYAVHHCRPLEQYAEKGSELEKLLLAHRTIELTLVTPEQPIPRQRVVYRTKASNKLEKPGGCSIATTTSDVATDIDDSLSVLSSSCSDDDERLCLPMITGVAMSSRPIYSSACSISIAVGTTAA